jgi:hypothetical protein
MTDKLRREVIQAAILGFETAAKAALAAKRAPKLKTMTALSDWRNLGR